MKKYRSKANNGIDQGVIFRLTRIKLTTIVVTLALFTSTASASNELPYYNGPDFTPHWLDSQGAVLDDFHRIPEFSFSNQSGRAVTQETIADKVYVASFFFSTCPGICPAIRSKLVKIQDASHDNGDVLILSHSIRPTTDTPAVLNKYAKQHGVTNDNRLLHFLRGWTTLFVRSLFRTGYAESKKSSFEG